ncbi:putative CDP-glycerol:glycerophosphate glycerophosphotransferase [Leucobacter sp. Psy1]|uniref:CDP-glycerol glycerophosphotransferase family protein n=1 Tax=Leucobacter sp. Psy1 TaxID=2875729 RepID=UPI00351D73ED|nr:putative CDP-glycerol:glycerophosphate glycerophosphotransferase [Leucobacter sp. Psy1]
MILSWVKIHTAKTLMAVVYWLLKRVTLVNPNKVVFLGRHVDRVPLDFRLLIAELKRRDSRVEVVVISKQFEGGTRDSWRFIPSLLRSLYELATSKVCVLDSYWPAVSILNHKKSLVVFQIWHSLGKIKRTGFQALDTEQGRSTLAARSMRMHAGYDYVVAGAKVWNPEYRAAFNVSDDQILNIGLPRADYLLNSRERIAAMVAKKYPEVMKKPIVLYTPTFRRHQANVPGARMLAEVIDTDRFNLVIKRHKDDDLAMPNIPHFKCSGFNSLEMLTVADYVITDYSSIALEAALIDVKTFYFHYDAEEYFASSGGINIDLPQEMPECVFSDAVELGRALEGEYPVEALQRYKSKFIFENPGQSTSDLANHIFDEGGLCSR